MAERQPNSDFFTPFELNVVKCLRRASGRSGYAAANAIHHLRRAWDIRSIDPAMAAFRAITAEEGAASALVLLLREKKYPHAARLSFRDHVTTSAAHCPIFVSIIQYRI